MDGAVRGNAIQLFWLAGQQFTQCRLVFFRFAVAFLAAGFGARARRSADDLAGGSLDG